MEESRQISEAEAARFAQERGMLFMEVSALTGDGINEAFLTLVDGKKMVL